MSESFLIASTDILYFIFNVRSTAGGAGDDMEDLSVSGDAGVHGGRGAAEIAAGGGGYCAGGDGFDGGVGGSGGGGAGGGETERETEREGFVVVGKGSFGVVFGGRVMEYGGYDAVGENVWGKVGDGEGSGLRLDGKVKDSKGKEMGSETRDVRREGVKKQAVVKRTIRVGQDENAWLRNDALWHERVEKVFDGLREGSSVALKSGESFVTATAEKEFELDLPHVPRFLGYLPRICQTTRNVSALEGREHETTTTYPHQPKIASSLNDWWASHRAGTRSWSFFSGIADISYQTPDQILLAERIPAIPKGVREGIIDRSYTGDAASVKQGREHPSNASALLRVYAGRDPEPERDHAAEGVNVDARVRRLTKMFSLLNYPLDLPSMKELMGEEQVDKAVRMLGTALAVLHFGVGCDARDVEFVLGANPNSRLKEEEETAKEEEGNGKRDGNVFRMFGEKMSIWLLDFNQVRRLPQLPFSVHQEEATGPEQARNQGQTQELGSQGKQDRARWLETAVSAFFANDPYYPRPDNGGTGGVWKVFSEAYLETASKVVVVLEGEESGLVSASDSERVLENARLAKEFLISVEKECLRRKEARMEREQREWIEG